MLFRLYGNKLDSQVCTSFDFNENWLSDFQYENIWPQWSKFVQLHSELHLLLILVPFFAFFCSNTERFVCWTTYFEAGLLKIVNVHENSFEIPRTAILHFLQASFSQLSKGEFVLDNRNGVVGKLSVRVSSRQKNNWKRPLWWLALWNGISRPER